jgi:glycosyltransferase involved in cell wall biosynthesis
MRVLVVTQHLAPELLAVWRACARPGIDLHVAGALEAPQIEAYAPTTSVPDWATTHVIKPRDALRRGPLWWYYPGLSRLVRLLRPDVVHVNGEPWAVPVTQVVSSRSRARVVIHGADNMFTHGARAEVAVRLPVARRNLKRAAAYVSWNTEGVHLARSYGLPGGAPTLVAPATVPDPARFVVGDRPARPYTVGFLGRLVTLKGADLLVTAAGLAGVPRVVIGGDGPQRDLLRRDGRVELVSGIAQADVPAFLAGLDVLVAPSRTMPTGAEQFGRVVVEAMWAGTPVIASDSGALPEVVRDAGIVVPEDDVAALAAALRELSWPERRAELRAAGLARAEAYRPERLADDLLALWARVA